MKKSKSKLTTEERVLQQLLTYYNSSSDNSVFVSKYSAQELNITEEEMIKSLLLLQDEMLISINSKFSEYDLSNYWNVSLKSSGIYYFKNKKKISIINKREWVRTYIPITISFIALIKSFFPEIISILKLLLKSIMNLLK